ncbi:hypothetical protein AB0F20_05670 [Streptomyces goshikiensis]|uniref:hypothetical protein n=1 Tax=Streptomyces goshikiensis TaxID=1942 RepID=UPI0033F91AD7
MPTFQIVTTDNRAYTEGRHAIGAFNDVIGEDESAGVLKAYRHEGDYVVLSYDSGFELAIPDHRIKHIADRAA